MSLGRGCSAWRAAGDRDTLCHVPPSLGEASSFPSEPQTSSGLAGAPSCPVVGAQPMGKMLGCNISFSAAAATMGMAVTVPM